MIKNDDLEGKLQDFQGKKRKSLKFSKVLEVPLCLYGSQ
jgi:hypothetical protein